MHKITILENEELYKVLRQAWRYLPGCTFYLAPSLNEEIITGSTVVIGEFTAPPSISQKDKVQKFIGLVRSGVNSQKTDFPTLKKPYYIKDIIERIQSIIAQSAASGEIIGIGSFQFNTQTRTLTKGAAEIALTEKEAELILLLLNASGEVSREEILKKVWGYEAGIDTHTIETHIYRIRQKLGKKDDFLGSSAAGYFIKTNP